jgi:hypothetical protein
MTLLPFLKLDDVSFRVSQIDKSKKAEPLYRE